MCYFKRYIFLTCGHSVLDIRPILVCSAAQRKSKHNPKGMEESLSAEQSDTMMKAPVKTKLNSMALALGCQGAEHTANYAEKRKAAFHLESGCNKRQTHPFQTFRIYQLCGFCLQKRDLLLGEAETGIDEVRFEEWRWKVRYLSSKNEAASESDCERIGETMGSWVGSWKGDWGRARDNWLAALRDTDRQSKGSLRVAEGSRRGLPSS